MRRWMPAVVSLIAVLTPRVVMAQAPALSLSVDEAVRRGLEAAPRLAAARSRETAASAAVTAQTAGGRPTITASGGYQRTNHVDAFGLALPDGTFRTIFPDIPDNYQLRAEADVPVYTAGRVGALVDSAKAGVTAAGADRQATEADLRLEIATAYWGLVTARESVTVLTEGLQRADAAVSDARAHVDAGFLPPNDVLSAQAERARESARLIQARHAAALAEVALDRLVGAPLDQAIVTTSSVTDASQAATALTQLPFADLVARAASSRPELASLRAQATALDASASASQALSRPVVGAFGAVQPARPNPLFVPRIDEWKTSWSLGVNVSWSIWDGGRARAQAASTSAQADAVRRQAEDAQAGIAVEIRQRLLDLDADRATIAASTEAVSAATEAHRVVVERFRAGVATSTEVLDAEIVLLESALDLTRLTATQRLDEARLLRAVGTDR